MTLKHPSLIVPRGILDLTRIRRRRAVLLVGTYPIRVGKLLLCTQDAADGAVLVEIGSVRQGDLGDMPLRVLEELDMASMAELLCALQRSDSKISLTSKVTFIEWRGVVSDKYQRVVEGSYVLSHEDVEHLLTALRPLIDKARGARSMAGGIHPAGSATVTPLQLARLCSAYHLIDDISRKGAKNGKEKS